MRDKCFVIMPFWVKPLPDSNGATFDFDKVYRVIIRRAIESAGMEPIRADEQTGSQIIHSDMFKELRDRAVVLADLSLNNPNVYYELTGIRHVLSPGGTVLICLAVGTPVTERPPHKPGRAVFPHPVPRSYSLSRKCDCPVHTPRIAASALLCAG
uniref:Uncharacterized protein n=1 Tax=Candidatus Kentrum sp. LPFa TaxID=2126335 RepID=A0A450XFB8_9GAMM|nr:MAG: hypothetical protein BECKLPF1236A_GA0070988_1006015 [Candidatus Kentron sp. LPFa]VFK27934.1 MAG: hypothetical protein BECKLPF1236C_GA0070990_100554 [Candidatus Kentron sp. LPFa]